MSREAQARAQIAKSRKRATDARRLRTKAGERETYAGRLTGMIATMEHERLRAITEAAILRARAEVMEL